jgi:hypothetical protein
VLVLLRSLSLLSFDLFLHSPPLSSLISSIGPGASVKLWKELFPHAELWEAEYNAGCVEKHRNTTLKGINVLIGDQENLEVLDSWVETSGGDFDVIIDDGGHTQCMIWNSFTKLWPTVKKGGLYFIEDLQVAKHPNYMRSKSDCDGTTMNVPNNLKDIIDNLLYNHRDANSEVESVFCQREACLLKKRK